MTTLSAALTLFLVMDPLGNVPTFMGLLAGIEPRRAQRIVVRELLIALVVLIVFLFAGRYLLEALHVTEPALSISGGVILFLIALKMIFASPGQIFTDEPDGEPFVVPLAIPLIAGPSAMATVLILMAQDPERWPSWLGAIALAWLVTGAILLLGQWLSRLLGRRGLIATQRLMGMLLTTVAIQMFLSGLQKFLTNLGAAS